MSAERCRRPGRPGPGACPTPIWQRTDHGGDREALRRVENGGIKAAEKAPRKAEVLCLMTEHPGFFALWIIFFTGSAPAHTGREQNFFGEIFVFRFTNRL